MDLYEYQARQLFKAHGVPVLGGEVASTAQQAREIAQELFANGSQLVVVKAQVKTGGRGKAGGVKLARSAQEAFERAQEILGMDIKGHTVHKVLISDGADIEQEFYFSVLLDRAQRAYLAMCSREGGMDIETLAKERPEALAKVAVDPLVGIDAAKAAEIVAAAGFEPGKVADDVAGVILKLWEVFTGEDATLVEVNPLVLTPQGTVLALDGKVSLDDNARMRHRDHEQFVDTVDADPLETRAKAAGLNYVRLTGEVGVLGNGAGLVMSLDVVAGAGERHGGMRPANFLDLGGGSSAQVMATGLEVVASDPQVRAILVNVFGGITSCVSVAEGIVAAVSSLGESFTKPIVVRLDGNQAEAGRAILAEANLPQVTIAETMDGAADRVTAIAQELGEN